MYEQHLHTALFLLGFSKQYDVSIIDKHFENLHENMKTTMILYKEEKRV